ncbi:threonine--tRNA ligase [bacterium]|nr:threonine--tRNA ligase [bacterium]
MSITLPNGKKRSVHRGTPVNQTVKEIFPDIYPLIIAAVLDNEIVDLSTSIEKDTTLNVLTSKEEGGLKIFWHSASHIMAQAVKSLYPETILGIGPAISNGFYYDFFLNDSITETNLLQIEKRMKEIIKEDIPFVKRILPKDEAFQLFEEKGERFKLELIQDIPGDTITIYENGDFFDLCRGPHVPSTGYIKYFQLLSVAGAYWRGDERNAVMQRIYGVAYTEEKALKEDIQAREEAQKRDHRRLGKELDLFSFHPEGPGFPFWHPNGVILYNEINQYMREVLQRKNYFEIKTPLILNEALWHQSGHWDNYKSNMYFTDIDDQSYAVKPMNCPGGLLIYKNSAHSYREFPLKYSEMGMVHRHEKSGVLHGLFRVRQFTQDDAHVFCTPDQVEEEIIKIIDLIDEIYHTFKFENFLIELSTRPNKSIGTAKMWNMAEKALTNALEYKKLTYQINKGEGAFYGPKIDYHIQDSIGRMWQCGTIQVDFSMPDRFDLEYVGPDGDKHRPVMIHRAILGSVERFIGILIEHFGGAFPVWLAPVQCVVLPISEKVHDYAHQVLNHIQKSQIRSVLDIRNEKIGYKIREAEIKKVPYMCIIGEKEKNNKNISVRKRSEGSTGQTALSSLITEIRDQIKRRMHY